MAGELVISVEFPDFEAIAHKIDVALDRFRRNVEGEAKMNAPKTTGEVLRASIQSDRQEDTVSFSVNVDNAAYIEFGTGQFAASYLAGMPQWVRDYAIQFFVNGMGRLPESPFLIPAMQRNLPLLVDEIKQILEE